MEIETLGNELGFMDANVNNRIQEIEEGIPDADDYIDSIDSTVKKCKMEKASYQNHSGNTGHNQKSKPKDYRYRLE